MNPVFAYLFVSEMSTVSEKGQTGTSRRDVWAVDDKEESQQKLLQGGDE